MLCYYFGTFNPVHCAHLKIADEVKKKCHFEKVLFVPSYCPPHKNIPLASAKERLEMLILAASKENVCDIEYSLSTPSYTYRTIEKLGRCSFIIGFDAFSAIGSWKNPEYLKEMLEFIVIPRRGENDFSVQKKAGYNFRVLELDFMDISSEDIRKKIRQDLPLGGLVPKRVEEYIYEHGLYRKD